MAGTTLPLSSSLTSASVTSCEFEASCDFFWMVYKKGHIWWNKSWSFSMSEAFKDKPVPEANTSKRKKFQEPVVVEVEDDYVVMCSSDDNELSEYEEEEEGQEEDEEGYDEEEYATLEDEGVGKKKKKNQIKKKTYVKSRRIAYGQEEDEEEEYDQEDEEESEEEEHQVHKVMKKILKQPPLQKSRRDYIAEEYSLKKKQLKNKRPRGESDDEEEEGKVVKKKLVLNPKKKAKRIEKTEGREEKSHVKHKGITKRGKKKRVFVQVPIPVNAMSRGEYAKRHDVVVATQRENCDRKQPSVICRTDAFSKIIAGLDDSRRDCVREMGFGGLLDLKISKLPRQLCYWLMTRFDGVNSYLVAGDGNVMPISPSHWQYVFGLKNSGLSVPEKDDELPPGRVLQMAQKYGEKNSVRKNKYTILISNSTRVLQGPLDEQGKIKPLGSKCERTEFMENFMIVLLGQILCPSTDGGNMSTKLLGAVCIAKDAAKYNWCEFCHKWLLSYAINCQRKLEVQGYAAGTGGCVLFLLIFYLDRLCRVPVRWDEFPRLKVWTEEEVDKVKHQDRKPSEDYGRLTTLDVVYGEPHPLFGREGRKPIAEQVADIVMEKLGPVLQDLRRSARAVVETVIQPVIQQPNRGYKSSP
ncbi:uncharacterized protein [Spinacia oleracea]|uniref:Uncharacterized protein n=1 Tax=Spinacia oleracea TaxID=3562 RepID=A0ABM3RRY2_SPIOL|nr:uncharacterized protein LOC110787125 [Spinacia oleracea]